MAFYFNLCSSSSGNCSYVGEKDRGILFDAGIGIRGFEKLLKDASIDPCGIAGVFITHEHSDHIKGLSRLLTKYRFPLFASEGTLEALLEKGAVPAGISVNIIDRPTEAGGYVVSPFPTSHDSAESLGFTALTPDGVKVGLCTDLGYISEPVLEAVSGCSFLMLESNYDREMLRNGIYPYYLKQRIAGSSGHLSNLQCAEGLKTFLDRGTRQVVLAHLSENNNLPSLAMETSIGILREYGAAAGRDYLLDVLPKCSEGRIFPFL